MLRPWMAEVFDGSDACVAPVLPLDRAPQHPHLAARGTFVVTRDGREIETLHPEKRVYAAQGMPMTEAAIDTTPLRDLYVSLGDPIDGDTWAVRVYHKPFVSWIWGGCALMALGGLLAVTDRRYRLATRRERELPANVAGA